MSLEKLLRESLTEVTFNDFSEIQLNKLFNFFAEIDSKQRSTVNPLIIYPRALARYIQTNNENAFTILELLQFKKGIKRFFVYKCPSCNTPVDKRFSTIVELVNYCNDYFCDYCENHNEQVADFVEIIYEVIQ